MGLSDIDRQRLIDATRHNRQRLGIDELQQLIDQPNAVRVIDDGSDWHANELATVLRVEPKRGRVTLRFSADWWDCSSCPGSMVARANEGGQA